MLKSVDKKIIYIFGALVGIPIFLILFLVMIKGCSSGKSSFSSYENKMISSAENYFTKKNMLPLNEGGTSTVSLSDLVSNGDISSPEKKLKDSSCTGSVSVRNNGGYYFYTPYLECKDYKTVYIIDKLKEGIVTEKSGLYETSDGYVYKGKKVNNYVSFFDKKYRIISIDNDGIMKLFKVDSEKDRVVWDSKYNTEVKRSYGKNDYADSYLFEVLSGTYQKVSDKQKKHLVARNICYGNRTLKNGSIDKSEECEQILDNQFVSTLNTYDFAMASYDADCVSIYSGACINYNYLYDTVSTTWLINGVKDNSYQVYYYSQGNLLSTRAISKNKYNLVIYLSGYELFTKGDGSKDNPYIIK